jgi:hypothetical protein
MEHDIFRVFTCKPCEDIITSYRRIQQRHWFSKTGVVANTPTGAPTSSCDSLWQ